MTPVISLRFLTEPTYALVGALLPAEDRAEEVRLLVSPNTVLTYPPQARPLLEYLSVLRSESDLLEQVIRWGGAPTDLDELIQDGLLIRFPANDEAAVRELVDGLILWLAAEAAPAQDDQSVLLRLPTSRAVAISTVTATVLDTETAGVRTLGEGIRDVAQRAAVPEDYLGRYVVHDLTAILTSGAGSLIRVGAAR